MQARQLWQENFAVLLLGLKLNKNVSTVWSGHSDDTFTVVDTVLDSQQQYFPNLYYFHQKK